MSWVRWLNGATRLNLMTFSITTLSIKGLFGTFSITTLSKTTLCHYAECRNDEYRYAECLGAGLVVQTSRRRNALRREVAAPRRQFRSSQTDLIAASHTYSVIKVPSDPPLKPIGTVDLSI